MKEYYALKFKHGLLNLLYAVSVDKYPTEEEAKKRIAQMFNQKDFFEIEANDGLVVKIRVEEVES